MTLEQFAYLGEIIAAVAVIASLIYVARQLGQNTAAIKSDASQGMQQQIFDFFSMLTAVGNTEIFIKAQESPSSLTVSEVSRFDSMVIVSAQAYQTLFFQVKEGVYDIHRAVGWWQMLRNTLEVPLWREHWDSNRYILSAEFLDFIEKDVMKLAATRSTAFLATNGH